MRKKAAMEYSVLLAHHFPWIHHGKLHQTWQNNQSPGLDSNPEYPEYRVRLLTNKTVSSVDFFRTLEPGSFPYICTLP